MFEERNSTETRKCFVAISVLYNMLLGQGEAEPTDDEELNQHILEQRRIRSAFRVYEDVDDHHRRLYKHCRFYQLSCF